MVCAYYEVIKGLDDLGTFELKRPRPDFIEEISPDSLIPWICTSERKEICSENGRCPVCKYEIKRYKGYLNFKKAVEENRVHWIESRNE